MDKTLESPLPSYANLEKRSSDPSPYSMLDVVHHQRANNSAKLINNDRGEGGVRWGILQN